MKRRSLLVATPAAAVLGAGSLFGGVLGELRPGAAPATRLAAARARRGPSRSAGPPRPSARLERAVRGDPRDAGPPRELGLAYQLRWRETGDPSFLPLSERALRRALEARPRDAAATLGLGNLALIRHDFRAALALGREARRRAPFAARPYGVVGDALIELGRYRAGLRGVRPDGGREAEPRLLRPRRLRARADRRPSRRRRGDATRARRRGRRPRAHGVGARGAREARARRRPRRTQPPGTCARRSRSSPATFSRSSRRPGSTPHGEGSAPRSRRHGGRRRRAAPAVRRAARRPARPAGSNGGGGASASDRRGHRPGACGERAARRPRERGLPGRPPHPAGGDGASRPPRPSRPALDLRRRRARVGTRARRDGAPRPSRGSTVRCASGRRTHSSTSTAGMPPAAPATAARCARGTARALEQSPVVLGEVGAGRSGGARVRRLASVVAALVAVAVVPRRSRGKHPRIRSATSRSTTTPGSRSPETACYVRYVLDLAEIPTFQSGDRVRAPRYPSELAHQLDLRLGGERVALRPLGTPRLGAPGSRRSPDAEVRGRLRRVAPRTPRSRSSTGASRAASAGGRSRCVPATVRASSRRPSRLRAARTSCARIRATSFARPSPFARRRCVSSRGRRALRLPGSTGPRRRATSGDGLAGLIGRDDPTFGVVLVSLLVAAFWGAAHALDAGHGKALVAGYLVGTRGRPRHAFALGATVTVTHTAGVFGLGLVTLGLSTVVVPERSTPG